MPVVPVAPTREQVFWPGFRPIFLHDYKPGQISNTFMLFVCPAECQEGHQYSAEVYGGDPCVNQEVVLSSCLRDHVDSLTFLPILMALCFVLCLIPLYMMCCRTRPPSPGEVCLMSSSLPDHHLNSLCLAFGPCIPLLLRPNGACFRPSVCLVPAFCA